MAIIIGVCTSALERNIGGLLSKLRSTLPMINFRMVPLPYNDLDSYPLEQERLDGLILCHSIQNRRLAITDVLDAIYDKFLPRAKKHLGKENVVVIAHDFSWPFQKNATMENFRTNQPTAVKCSSLVLLSGKLDNTVQMDSDDWNQLTAYAREVKPLESSPMKSAFDVVINWFQSAMSLVIFVIMCIFMSILVIISSIGLIPLLPLIIVAVLLSYWFWKIKNKQHNSGIREGDGGLHDVKSHGLTVEERKKGYRK